MFCSRLILSFVAGASIAPCRNDVGVHDVAAVSIHGAFSQPSKKAKQRAMPLLQPQPMPLLQAAP